MQLVKFENVFGNGIPWLFTCSADPDIDGYVCECIIIIIILKETFFSLFFFYTCGFRNYSDGDVMSDSFSVG